MAKDKTNLLQLELCKAFKTGKEHFKHGLPTKYELNHYTVYRDCYNKEIQLTAYCHWWCNGFHETQILNTLGSL